MQLFNDMRWFDRARDMDAVKRIWAEVGWAPESEEQLVMEDMFSVGRTLVGVMDDEAECAVHVVDGNIRYQAQNLSLAAVTAVTTSRIGRKRSFAKRLTATQLGVAAESGMAVAALGMFEQGFYDLLGFGTGTYEQEFRFDPATLQVDTEYRTPKRLTRDDYGTMSEALAQRARNHGSVVLYPPEIVRAECGWSQNGFGLGYETDGVLSHFMWLDTEEVEHGPYRVRIIAYADGRQLLELLAVLKSLGDQVSSVQMIEPPHIVLQDLLHKPFRSRDISKGSKHQSRHYGEGFWQLRMLDVEQCVRARNWQGEPFAFQVELTDPAPQHTAGGWSGVAGRYVVEVAAESNAARGDAARPSAGSRQRQRILPLLVWHRLGEPACAHR